VLRGLWPVLAGLTAALAVAVPAFADGDPASDILPTDSVYFPINQPSQDAESALTSAVSAVYANGDRVKVAVIATPDDLGAIPSLMNKPDDYAKFLGQELAGFYVGPLLIVMPSGWGIYDGGRSVSAESGVLSGIGVSGSSPDNLVRSAATAVQKMEAAGALKSPDVRPPYVYAQAETIHPGKPAVLFFRVLDDSNRSAVAVTILVGGKTIASLTSPLGPTNYPNARSVTWPVPKKIAKKGVKVCMTATDAAGNKSTPPSCMPLKVGK
jgi:uncharacterized protein GlcG (DUF336 family)